MLQNPKQKSTLSSIEEDDSHKYSLNLIQRHKNPKQKQGKKARFMERQKSKFNP